MADAFAQYWSEVGGQGFDTANPSACRVEYEV